MKDILKRLEYVGRTISEILEISGAAGVSIGILHHNEVIHTAGYGYRDVEQKIRPDENTIYHLASLSKSFTATAIGILVEQKQLAWDEPLSEILPEFTHEDAKIQKNVTILDFLAHRTGLATKNSLWVQDGPELLFEPKDLMSIVSYLEVVHPLRSTWLYNNWGYNLAAEVIEKKSKKSWGSFLSEQIFEPLGLKRTFTEERVVENVAKGYFSSREGTPILTGSPLIAQGTIMQGANGIRSNVKDLLTYYKAVVSAWKDQSSLNSTSTPGLPFKNIRTLLTGHIPINPDSKFEESYGAGWAITQLPSPVGSIGINGMFLEEMPAVGKGLKRRQIWYHNGSLVGFFSSIHIIPDSDTAIVVLVNSYAKNDCADWIGQLLLETVLNNLEKNDYVGLAKESANAYEKMWDDLKADFERSKTTDMSSRAQDQYAGRFFNAVHNWFIEVVDVEGSLEFSFQGLSTQKHKLLPYGVDTFSWLVTENESLQLGRWPDLDACIYVFYFGTDESGVIDSLRWIHDGDLPEGEVFRRSENSDTGKSQRVLGRETTIPSR